MLVTVDNLSINPMTVKKVESAQSSMALMNTEKHGAIITMKNGDIIYLPHASPHKLSTKLMAKKYLK